jgi:hypothetical protein
MMRACGGENLIPQPQATSCKTQAASYKLQDTSRKQLFLPAPNSSIPQPQATSHKQLLPLIPNSSIPQPQAASHKQLLPLIPNS